MPKILLVEDDPYLSGLISELLGAANHDVEVLHDGAIAIEHLRTFPFDLLILDVALPGADGFEILKSFRDGGGVAPALMLTGRSSITDKERGFNLGADDYLPKPFDMRELLARVSALLRRPLTLVTDRLTAGEVVFDRRNMAVTKNGELVNLAPKEISLLEFFLRHQGQVFSLEALLNRVWPSESDSTEEAIRSVIKRLRKKLDPEGRLIHSIHGLGYKFELSASADGADQEFE